MNVRHRRPTALVIGALAALLLMLLGTPGPAGAAGGPAMQTQARPLGQPLGAWSARWWQFVYQFPVHNPPYSDQVYNPLFDETGSQCTLGQSKRVWYLVGVINQSGTATRDCTIPKNVYLFIAILNAETDNACVDPPLGVRQLRREAAKIIGTTTELHATLDGSPVSDNLFGLRVESPVFSYTLPPDDNIAQYFGCDISGKVAPVVGDGYYVMLPPLSPGQHTINFGGTLGPPYNFTLDITYNLTVTG